MLGVHLPRGVRPRDTDRNSAEEGLVFLEGIPFFLETQELIELAEFYSFLTE